MSQLDKAVLEDMIATLEMLILSACDSVIYHSERKKMYELKLASYKSQIRVLEEQHGKL